MAITALTHILRSIFLHIPEKPLLGMRPVVYTRIPWGAKKRKHFTVLPFFIYAKQVILPCVNHDAGRDGRHRDGHRHDAHDARRHGRLKLQMQKRLRWG